MRTPTVKQDFKFRGLTIKQIKRELDDNIYELHERLLDPHLIPDAKFDMHSINSIKRMKELSEKVKALRLVLKAKTQPK